MLYMAYSVTGGYGGGNSGNNGGGTGGRGGGRRGGRRGGGRGGQQQQQQYQPQQQQYQPPPVQYTQYQPPAYQQQYQGGAPQQGNYGGGQHVQNAPGSNTRKRNDNDWFCWSCGFDVNHTSQECRTRKFANHQNAATRYNLGQFVHCGAWCRRNEHKDTLPNGTKLQWPRVQPMGNM